MHAPVTGALLYFVVLVYSPGGEIGYSSGTSEGLTNCFRPPFADHNVVSKES